MARRVVWLGAVAVAVGLAAEWAAYGWSDVRHWVPDLLTGWVVISCGLAGWVRRPDSRVGPLLVAAGFAWFLGNFAASAGVLGGLALFLHRGFILHILLAYPTGRLRARIDQAAVVAGYVAVLLTPVWGTEVATIALAALLVVSGIWSHRRAPGRYRSARALALQAAIGLALVLVGGVVVRAAVPSGAANYPALLVYQVALCTVAGVILAGLYAASWEREAVTDLVIELGDTRGATVDGALAWALGDPALRVGLWHAETAAFVDHDGRPVTPPTPPDSHQMTVVEQDGQPVAAIVHDATALQDPGVIDAVAAAVRLAASNASLRADVQRQAAEVRASRRRLLHAADEEGRRLERDLRDGAERLLAELAEVLDRARNVAESEKVRTRIEGTHAELGRTVEELAQLAQGLHPTALSERGLAGAIAELASRLEVSVDVDVTRDRLSPDVEAAVYFICSEALTNVAKHASATRATVCVSHTDGWALVEVSDNGVGGAGLTRGSGLQGLADRVDALGGRLEMDSARGRGTRLTVEMPTDR